MGGGVVGAKVDLSIQETFNRFNLGGGTSIAQWLTDPAAPSLTPGIAEIIIDVAEVNQRHWSEDIGQWLENVD